MLLAWSEHQYGRIMEFRMFSQVSFSGPIISLLRLTRFDAVCDADGTGSRAFGRRSEHEHQRARAASTGLYVG